MGAARGCPSRVLCAQWGCPRRAPRGPPSRTVVAPWGSASGKTWVPCGASAGSSRGPFPWQVLLGARWGVSCLRRHSGFSSLSPRFSLFLSLIVIVGSRGSPLRGDGVLAGRTQPCGSQEAVFPVSWWAGARPSQPLPRPRCFHEWIAQGLC